MSGYRYLYANRIAKSLSLPPLNWKPSHVNVLMKGEINKENPEGLPYRFQVRL